MTQYFKVHPDNPQQRLIDQAVAILRRGGVAAYPTDSCYALGCLYSDKAAINRIKQIRQLDEKHHLTLLCRDLTDIGSFAVLDNAAFRLIKSLTPGPYTFLLKASRDVPRRLQHPHRKTIGLRIPDNPVALALLETLGEPMLSTSLIMPGEEYPETDVGQIRARLGKQIDVIIDGGDGAPEQTSVVDLSSAVPGVVREGKGDISRFTG